MCIRIPVRLLGRMLKTSLNSGPSNTEWAFRREKEQKLKHHHERKQDTVLKRQRHKPYRTAPYPRWHDLLLRRNKCLSPKDHPSKKTPRSLKKGYPSVLNPAESSSGIPQSCLWGGSATKQKRKSSLPTPLRKARVAKAKGTAACTQKGEGR